MILANLSNKRFFAKKEMAEAIIESNGEIQLAAYQKVFSNKTPLGKISVLNPDGVILYMDERIEIIPIVL